MRLIFTGIFALMAIALGACSLAARRSPKAIGRSVSLLVAALIPPVIGNMIIIASGVQSVSAVGSYVYFLGMDLVMAALLQFTLDYCELSRPNRRIKWLVWLLLAGDAIQLLMNPVFHHAFGTEPMLVDGWLYYRLRPYLGQAIHRVVDYGIFGAVLVIFAVKLARSPRIYSERYSVLLATMVVTGLWETFYIFSRSPIDRSMIGFGAFGLMVFYFALFYRPMRLLDRMLASIASEMKEALFFFDAADRCIWANSPGKALAGITGENYDRVPAALSAMFGPLDGGDGDWSEERVIGAGDAARYYALERHAVTDDRNRVDGSFLSVRDDTEAHGALRQRLYAATHDALTGLYTRQYLYERARDMIAAHPDERFLVVFVDIKDFKLVNEIFGTDFGDFALRRVAEWIRSRAGDACAYGRLAGDTFGVCMPRTAFDPERVEAELAQFVVSDGAAAHGIQIHLGVYEVTDPQLDVSVMFDRAHLALSTIKEDFQRHIAWYDDEMRRRVLWNQHISSQLHDAIARRQIRPYLQPIVDDEGRVVGAEALVRWIHPTDGFLSPASFIPVFEKNGMIAEVDRSMWRWACEILAGWSGPADERFISVNISPVDFYFMDVAAELKAVVAEYGVSPSRLRLEITETVVITDVEKRMNILRELREAGFIIEMDDFGSGYSSLNMLKDMPVDVLKIDMVFLSRANDDARARTVVRNVIRMSRELGIAALTEGVEEPAQRDMLLEMGCALFQGYFFAKPMPVNDFEVFCENNGR